MTAAFIDYPISLYWAKLAKPTLTASNAVSLSGRESECFFCDEDAEIAVSHWLEDGEFQFSVKSFIISGGFEYSPGSGAPGVRDIFAAAKNLLENDGKFSEAVWNAAAADYADLGRDANGAPCGLTEAR